MTRGEFLKKNHQSLNYVAIFRSHDGKFIFCCFLPSKRRRCAPVSRFSELKNEKKKMFPNFKKKKKLWPPDLICGGRTFLLNGIFSFFPAQKVLCTPKNFVVIV